MYGLNLYWSIGGDDIYALTADQNDEYDYRIVFDKKSKVSDSFIKLDLDSSYIIGLDMSYTQSGISLWDSRLNLVAMIDVINPNLGGDVYENHISSFLCENFEHVKLEHVILEGVIKTKFNSQTFADLTKLQNILKRNERKLGRKFDGISPGIWMGHFLKNSTLPRKNSKEKKIATGDMVMQRYPEFSKYIQTMRQVSKASQGYICDSCDAVGIVAGFCAEYYISFPKRVRQVSRTMEMEYSHNIIKDIFKFNKISKKFYKKAIYSEGLVEGDLKYWYGPLVEQRGVMGLYFNPSLNVDENCRRVTSVTNEIVTIIVADKKTESMLKWDTSMDLEPDEKFVVVTYRQNISKGAKAR